MGVNIGQMSFLPPSQQCQQSSDLNHWPGLIFSSCLTGLLAAGRCCICTGSLTQYQHSKPLIKCVSLPSVLCHCWLGGRKGIQPVNNMGGGWWRWALVSPGGVAPSRMVGVSASVNLPLHHKVQKFLFWHRLTRVVPEKGP